MNGAVLAYIESAPHPLLAIAALVLAGGIALALFCWLLMWLEDWSNGAEEDRRYTGRRP